MTRRELIALLGGVGVWPVEAHAQQKPIPIIGYLHFGLPGLFAYQVAALRQGLSETGYVEGQNVAIEYRWGEGKYDRLPRLAADLIDRQANVIVAVGPPCAHAAKSATTTTPIVFVVGTDPVADGLVATLSRPGGNMTGVSILAADLTAKRFELLLELVPHATVIALLVNPKNTNPWIGSVQEAAHVKGVQLQILKASAESEIEAAFATLVRQHADALVIGDDVFFSGQREQLVSLTARYSIPSIERWREFAASGGLISYGPSLRTAMRQLGIYAGRVLKGEKPADLPVEQSSKFELVINLKTAKVLGLTIPQSLLLRADEVIE